MYGGPLEQSYQEASGKSPKRGGVGRKNNRRDVRGGRLSLCGWAKSCVSPKWAGIDEQWSTEQASSSSSAARESVDESKAQEREVVGTFQLVVLSHGPYSRLQIPDFNLSLFPSSNVPSPTW